MDKYPYLLAASLVLADPTATLAQGGSSWVDPPKSIERPAAPAAAEPARPLPAASVPKPAKPEPRAERRVERKRKIVAARPKPRVVRARSNDHFLARLFGPGRRGPFVINSSLSRS